ncbi:MAG: YHYH protein [Psychromonas sp.]
MNNYNNNKKVSNKFMALKVLIIPMCLLVSGCQGLWEQNDDEDDGEDSGNSSIDITDIILTERSEDCRDYTDKYKASVTDISNLITFDASLTISSTNGQCKFVSNSIPNHDFNNTSAFFEEDVKEIDLEFFISQNPTLASTTTELSETTSNAIFLNGVVLALHPVGCYRPNSEFADSYGNAYEECGDTAAWFIDPLGLYDKYYDKYGADQHNALTFSTGQYHYHGNPEALFDDSPDVDGSPVIGFAADGFPIYGSYFYDEDDQEVRKAISGYTLKEGDRQSIDGLNPSDNSQNSDEYDGTYLADWEFTDDGDLDECNGMTVDGQYGYYVTDSYPWVMGCFSGTPNSSFQ